MNKQLEKVLQQKNHPDLQEEKNLLLGDHEF